MSSNFVEKSVFCACPACGQGDVHHVMFSGSGREGSEDIEKYVLLCDECDALWLPELKVEAATLQQRSYFLKNNPFEDLIIYKMSYAKGGVANFEEW